MKRNESGGHTWRPWLSPCQLIQPTKNQSRSIALRFSETLMSVGSILHKWNNMGPLRGERESHPCVLSHFFYHILILWVRWLAMLDVSFSVWKPRYIEQGLQCVDAAVNSNRFKWQMSNKRFVHSTWKCYSAVSNDEDIRVNYIIRSAVI